MSQEVDANVLDLVEQIGFYLYEYMSDYKKLKEGLPSTGKFYSSLLGKKHRDKEYEHVFKVWDISQIKTM